MYYTFADIEEDDRDIAIFTKRLDTLLAATTVEAQEVERLPAALSLLSEDTHLSEGYRAKLRKVLEEIHESSTAVLDREIAASKQELRDLNDRISGSRGTATGRDRDRDQSIFDRDRINTHIAELETKRKEKSKLPTRSTLKSFTAALEEAQAVPEFYLLALKNGFNTNATLRKVLQSLLSLWGFEGQLR